MARTPPVLVVAVLLVLAAIASPAQAAGTVDAADGSSPAANTSLQTYDGNVTRGLHLQDSGASNVTTADTDASSLLDVQASSLRSRYETYRLEERMSSLDSRDARRELLRESIANVSARLDDLKAEERTARLAYVDGDLSASEFVVALARVSAKAEHTEAKMTYVRERFGNEFPNVVRTELPRYEPEVGALQGPVRAHAADVLRGERTSNRLYVAASENGTRLSMIQGRTWRSQTTRWDNFDRAVHPVNDIESEVTAALEAAHPGLNFSQRTPTLDAFGENPDLFSAERGFAYGETFGYFDGSTGSLFYEEQELFLDSLPAVETEREIENGRILTVNSTYAGGPLKIRLANRSGTPLDGEVLIDGESVGSTGFDGTLWTVGPPDAYNVTVIHEGERIQIEAVRSTTPE